MRTYRYKNRYKKPYRIKRKKPIFRSRFFWLTLLFILAAGAVFYLAVFSSIFQIKEIRISGNEKVSAPDVENTIKKKINKKMVFFPTRSIFLINSGEIIKTLSREFPQIASLNLERKLPAALSLEIQERRAAGFFCQKEDCFLIDGTGVIFEKGSPDGKAIIRFKDKEMLLSMGQKIIEEDAVSSILEIKEKLGAYFKIAATEFIIGRERINIRTTEGWEIYFDPSKDINWQLTKLSLVLEKQIPPERRKDLEYIELRFGNITSFKYRD